MIDDGIDADLQEKFLDVMGGVCTPVSVITSLEGGRPHGTTVSAFGSLSLRPPMVMVALDEQSELLSIIRRTRRFGVNILSRGQSELAMTFAGKGVSKFSGVDWTERSGLPALHSTAGWLACECADLVTGGDHTIVLGSVIGARPAVAPPLIYHRRLFGTHQPMLSTTAEN